MLYKLDDYWKDEILKAAAVLNDRKKQDDSSDFVHIGNDTYIDVENLLSWIENLDYELEHVRGQLKELEGQIEDNYVPRYKDKYEEYGVSPRDFL